jgi:hypothetical protein
LATAAWAGTGASLSLSNAQTAKSSGDAKTALHEVFSHAGDVGEVGKRKSELIYCTGVVKTKSDFDAFRTQMKILENIADATFTYTHAGQKPYDTQAVYVLHFEIELRKGTEIFLADWSVEMAERS